MNCKNCNEQITEIIPEIQCPGCGKMICEMCGYHCSECESIVCENCSKDNEKSECVCLVCEGKKNEKHNAEIDKKIKELKDMIKFLKTLKK